MTDGQTYIQSESKANILRKSKSENTKNTILPSAWKPSCALVEFLFTADCKHSEAEGGQKIQICNQGGVAPILRNVNSKLQTFWGRKRSKDTHLYPPLHCTKVWGITSINHIWHLPKHRERGAIQNKTKLDYIGPRAEVGSGGQGVVLKGLWGSMGGPRGS